MPRHFDADLLDVNADKIKPMLKTWGGSYKLSKYDGIRVIVAALKDPARVEAVVAALEPWERNALALVKRMGGTIEHHALVTCVLASGLHPNRIADRPNDLVDRLFRRGLILSTDPYGPGVVSRLYQYGGDITLYSDERILAHVGHPETMPMNIKPMPTPQETRFRRPSSVTLDIVAMLQAVANMGSLKLTKSGRIRAYDATTFRKLMQWNAKGIDIDGFVFDDPAKAWLSALRCSDILNTDQLANEVRLAEAPDDLAQRPLPEQVRGLMDGFIRSGEWWEISPGSAATYLDTAGDGRRQGRLALRTALAALPLDANAFYSFEDFDRVFYARVGEYFALDYPPTRPYFYASSARADSNQEVVNWRARTRQKWLAREYAWFVSAFTSWLYFLGLVEVAIDDGRPVGFRITELGGATLHPEMADASPPASNDAGPTQAAWVVQPNFDVITYLDRANVYQLAFLERHAERTQSHPHTVHYRLTRDSVYRGLQGGSTIDDIIDKLQAGSAVDMPQNVLVELREWASLSERIVLRRSSRLVEFPSAQALQAALAQGFPGRMVAERFLLQADRFAFDGSSVTVIDYAAPPARNLTLTESGVVRWPHGCPDLMTPAQLSQWAARKSDTEWELTANSVSGPLRSGRRINELLAFLQNRLSLPMPGLVEVALRSWAGEAYTAELESVIILRCPDEHVVRALIDSPMVAPTLRGYIHPDLLCIKPEELETLRRHLDWLGWRPSGRLRMTPAKSGR